MRVFAFAIIAASALGDDPGAVELVRLLGSADRAEREEAVQTLRELGAAALPALRAAEKAGAGEGRSRAASLARWIEGRLLERPSLIAVDFSGQTLKEAIQTLAARSGYTIELDSSDSAALSRRPIVARAPAPVSFWEALDMVGRAGHVRHDPGAGIWDRSRVLVLHIADGEPPSSTLYRGPFRVHLVALHCRRDLELGSRLGHEPSSQGVLYVDLQAFVEPARFLDFDGMPSIEAIDDLGHPLPAPPADAEWPQSQHTPWNVPGAIAVVQWRLPLGLPDARALTLRRVRGKLPVIVSATRPDPLVISLDDAPGKSYRHDETTLRFRIIHDSARELRIEVNLTQDPSPTASHDDRAQGALRHRFGFEDRAGRPLIWQPLHEHIGPGNETHIHMTISKGERPVRLRFHGLVWSSAEIPFEFADVPLR
jgi:hypothetical protein